MKYHNEQAIAVGWYRNVMRVATCEVNALIPSQRPSRIMSGRKQSTSAGPETHIGVNAAMEASGAELAGPAMTHLHTSANLREAL
jgi:hypothetical protein